MPVTGYRHGLVRCRRLELPRTLVVVFVQVSITQATLTALRPTTLARCAVREFDTVTHPAAARHGARVLELVMAAVSAPPVLADRGKIAIAFGVFVCLNGFAAHAIRRCTGRL